MNLPKLSVLIVILVLIEVFHFGAGMTSPSFVFGSSSYTFHENHLRNFDWKKSRQRCRDIGSDLVSIESKEEWFFLKETIQKKALWEYFIGLKKDSKSKEWRWISDNSKVNATVGEFPWAKNEPNGDGNCAVMYKDYMLDHGRFNDLNCTKKLKVTGYICESSVNSNNQEDGDKRCSCYDFINEEFLSWTDASVACKFNNTYLVVMETEREWEFIKKEIQTERGRIYDEWHIGLYRNLTTKNWTWVNGKALTIFKWQDGKPQDDDFYALMAKEFPPGFKGSFNSIRRKVFRGWICEKETDNCQGVCLGHNLVETTATSPITIASPTKDPTRDPQEGKQAYDKDNCSFCSLSVIILASSVAVLCVALLILGACLLRWRKKQRKDTRKATDTGTQLDNQDGSLLSPENAARQLGFSDEPESHGIRLEYQRQRTDQDSRQECQYTMLSPRTMMVPGDSSYASLTKSKQEECTNGSSAGASPLLQQDTESYDELLKHINVQSAKHI